MTTIPATPPLSPPPRSSHGDPLRPRRRRPRIGKRIHGVEIHLMPSLEQPASQYAHLPPAIAMAETVDGRCHELAVNMGCGPIFFTQDPTPARQTARPQGRDVGEAAGSSTPD